MDPIERFSRIQSLFEAVIDLPVTERTVALREACGDDASLFATVWALVRADDGDVSTLDLLSTDEQDLKRSSFGEFRLVGLLSRREQTTSWEAREPGSDHVLELSEVRDWSSLSAVERERREETIKMIASLDAPALPSGLRLTVEEAEAAVIHEQVRGVPLVGAAILAHPVDATQLLAQAAEGLMTLHAEQCVHGALGIGALVYDGIRARIVGFGESISRTEASPTSDRDALLSVVRQVHAAMTEGRIREALGALLASPPDTMAGLAEALRGVEYGTPGTVGAIGIQTVESQQRLPMETLLRDLLRRGELDALFAKVEQWRAAGQTIPAAALSSLVIARKNRRQNTLALRELARMRAQARAENNLQSEVWSWKSESTARGDDAAGSLAAIEEGLALLDAHGDTPRLRAELLSNKARWMEKIGRMRASRRLFGDSARIFLSQRDHNSLMLGALSHSGWLHTREQHDECIHAGQASLKHAELLQYPAHQIQAHSTLATSWRRLGRASDCLEAAEAGLALQKTAGTRINDWLMHWNRAWSFTEQGRLSEAEEAFEHALTCWIPRAYRISLQLDQTSLLIEQGRTDEARVQIAAILSEQEVDSRALAYGRLLLLEVDVESEDPVWFQRLLTLLEQASVDLDWGVELARVLLRHAGTRLTAQPHRAAVLTEAAARWIRQGRERWRQPALDALIEQLRERGAPAPVGRYLLQEILGVGGMGTVFKAVSTTTGEAVAAKVLRRWTDEAAQRSLEAELTAIGSMAHPRIVRLRENERLGPVAARLLGLDEGAPAIFMDLAAGGPMTQAERRLDQEQLVEVAEQVLEALTHAHARGIIHLDIKPANLLLHPERGVLLTDFGIAHLQDRGADVPMHGTPGYAAPEQLLGQNLGPWSDLYSLGITLLVLHTGSVPEDSDPIPESIGDAALRGWLRTMLAPAPSQRFESAPAAHRALPGATRAPTTIARMLPVLQAISPPRSPELLLLQSPPLIGHHNLQKQLWDALQATIDGPSRQLTLVGPLGVGKSHLAMWLRQTGLEQGIARETILIDPPDPAALRASHPQGVLILTTARQGEGIVVPLLSEADMRRLGTEGLGLRADLAGVLAARVGGCPGLLVESVRQEVFEGNLLSGDDGMFRLPDAGRPLATTWAELARRRIERLFGRIEGDNHQRLALSWQHRELRAWLAACEDAGVDTTPSWIARLLRSGLAIPDGPGRWIWRSIWVLEELQII